MNTTLDPSYFGIGDTAAATEPPPHPALRDIPRPPIDNAQHLPITLIQPDPNNPRKRMDTAKLAELARDIDARGVLQPINVRYKPGAVAGEPLYVIVCGERRWRATMMAAEAAKPAPAGKAAKAPSGNRKAPAAKGKPLVKYRDAATGSTWSDRGLQPKWLKTALANGHTLAEFAAMPPVATTTHLSAEAAQPR